MFTVVDKGQGRRIVKISVSGEGKEALTRVAGRYGMKEYVVGGRVFEWFMRQDDLFQRAVLGLLDGLKVDAARVFMERLADEVEPVEGFVTGSLGAKAPPPDPKDRPAPRKKPRRPERNERP